MTLRPIHQVVVHVDETAAAADRVGLAAQLAAKTKASLEGVFWRSRFMDELLPQDSIGYMSPNILDSMVHDHEREVTKLADAARIKFEGACADAGLVSSWREFEGAAANSLTALIRRTDLTVVGTKPRSAFRLNGLSAGRLALEAGGPIVVVREEEPGQTIGERVVVAWKGNRESARALHDAWPILARAKSVCVVMVRPAADIGADSDLQRHLERHGIDAEIIIDDLPDVEAGRILRRHIERLSADLLVMGLYGRPRLSEILFGGVTQEFLEDPPAPLFLSH